MTTKTDGKEMIQEMALTATSNTADQKVPGTQGVSDAPNTSSGRPLVSEKGKSEGESRPLVPEAGKSQDGKSSVPVASFNFINSIIGSGIIGIPFALKQAGIGMGVILLIFVAIVTDRSIILLIEAGQLSQTTSYQDMATVAFGKPGFFLVTTLQFFYPLIAMISYNVIIGDTITKIVARIGGDAIATTPLGNRQFIIFFMTLTITLPLSLYRNITKLGKWAFLSLILELFIVICVGIRFGTFFDNLPATDDAWTFANTNITQGIAIMAFAYMCHHNTFLIHASLGNPTKERWNFVTHVSVLFSMVVLLFFGLLGYATFTGYTQGDLTENYCEKDQLINVARLAFAFTVMLTFPIESFVTREVLEHAFFTDKQPTPLLRHIIVTVLVTICTMAVAMTTNCLSVVLELNGAIGACPLMFIIPPCCVIKLRQSAILSRDNAVPILIAVFGTLATVVGFVTTVLTFSDAVKCRSGEEMPYCPHPTSGPVNFTNSSALV